MPSRVPIENGLQIGTLASSAMALALVTITVGLRLLAKYQGKGWDAGDLCVVGAFVSIQSVGWVHLVELTDNNDR